MERLNEVFLSPDVVVCTLALVLAFAIALYALRRKDS